MELALCLGEPSTTLKLGFCKEKQVVEGRKGENDEEDLEKRRNFELENRDIRSVESPIQHNFLPLLPISQHEIGFPWSMQHRKLENRVRGFDVNEAAVAEEVAAVSSSSPNSTVSSYNAEFACGVGLGAAAGEVDRASSRPSDDEDNGGLRKKLRLSKEQSAFLEESFKEHSTLNPKQKIALAKQLNLRPRQVEVWFQNRRARTKLKQTEVDCEYLKSCCETLREENRRLQKELTELRALKTWQPFYMQLPATTLSMCPQCERISSSTGFGSTGSVSQSGSDKPPVSLFTKYRLCPFANPPSAAS